MALELWLIRPPFPRSKPLAARVKTTGTPGTVPAISALRAARKPNDEWNELRSELLELKEENREIRQQLEEIKKKSELPERKPQEKAPDKSASP